MNSSVLDARIMINKISEPIYSEKEKWDMDLFKNIFTSFWFQMFFQQVWFSVGVSQWMESLKTMIGYYEEEKMNFN